MKFVCDAMLGKLAKYLRLLGFDASYARNKAALTDRLSQDPDRILLTRRSGSEFSSPTIHIRSELVREQLDEIKGLIKAGFNKDTALSRCVECNVSLAEVDKEEVESRVPEFVYHTYARFRLCPSCKRVYWEGSHAKGMGELIKEMLR
jgi:uncharacterized protein